MFSSTRMLVASLFVAVSVFSLEPGWRNPYAGEEAVGDDIIALWHFDKGSLADASGNGHDLKLRGKETKLIADGRFSGALESVPSTRELDIPRGAVAKNHPSLTPKGAFSLEAWCKFKPEFGDYPWHVIFDKKNYYYASEKKKANTGYMLYFKKSGKKMTLILNVGLGDRSVIFSSRSVDLKPSEWYHVAATYDPAGEACFYLNGASIGRDRKADCGPVAPGSYPLAVGDRVGSTYKGFTGFIDEARISNGIKAFFTGEVLLFPAGGRRVFVRCETDAAVQLGISNDSGLPLPAGKVEIELGGQNQTFPVPALPAGSETTVRVPLDSRVRPGDYTLNATYTAGTTRESYTLPVTIVPRPLPNVMPVVMWGSGDLDEIAAIGFTHCIRWMGYFDGAVIKRKAPAPDAINSQTVQLVREGLEEFSRKGLGAILKFYPGSYLARHEKLNAPYQRVDRAGKPRSHANVCGNHPDIPVIGRAVSASAMQAFGDLPAVQSAMIQSEVRDGNDLCFHDFDREKCRRETGADIPEVAVSKRGVKYFQLPGFPADRVIPDDDPLLRYYRWFWKDGDGWNDFHSAIHEGVKSTGREDVWTYHDPAVRVPSIWGSGGDVDVISQWTYTYPDPIKIGQAADELFAMAAGHPGQKVMKMTQIIWKRFQTTVAKTPEEQRSAWEKDLPKAVYYSCSPDHLREAFWSKISRPVQGIMYHGWGSLVLVNDNKGGYVYTNPGVRPALQELIHTVVRPLGPTLLQVGDAPTDVALLESFTSQMFAGRGPYGWGRGWTADAHLILQWAGLQPRILYEETLLRDKLAGIKVLVLPDCDVLPASVASLITSFQENGGLVVGDENLCPAIIPDILLPNYQRTGQADKDKEALQKIAGDLRFELDTIHDAPFSSSTPDLVVRRRNAGLADYVFVVNDRRTFGDYVGQHGKVMEKGLPLEGEVCLRGEARYVYDLTANRVVAAKRGKGEIRIPVRLGPGGGNLFLTTPQKIGKTRIAAPRVATRGRKFTVKITVLGKGRKAFPAVIPLQVELLDPQGRLAEFSGYYGAKDGSVSIDFLPGSNDLEGKWNLRVRNLATGRLEKETVTIR